MNTRALAICFDSNSKLHILRAIIIVAVVLLPSCRNEPTAPRNYYSDPTDYRHATFPLAVGNQWAYIDSFYTLFGSPYWARIKLASIYDFTQEHGQGTWKFTNVGALQPNYSGQYSIMNDTVYIDDASVNGALLNPRIAFLPASSIRDTVAMPGPYPWSLTKVFPLGHTMVTPAGTFDSVYVYQFDWSGRTVTFFRPTIGVILKETYSSDNILTYRSVLISYMLLE